MKANILKTITALNKEDAIPQLDNLVMHPGDVVLINITDGSNTPRLYSCCPQCAAPSFTGNHKITNNNGILSATPSLVFQCCGWHGWLKNGEFVK